MMRTTLTLVLVRTRTGNQVWSLATVTTVQRAELRGATILLALLRGELPRNSSQGMVRC